MSHIELGYNRSISPPSVNGGDYEIGRSVRVSVYMMNHNGNDVITPTRQAATPAVTFTSLCEAALPSFSPFLVVVGCSCICRCSSNV